MATVTPLRQPNPTPSEEGGRRKPVVLHVRSIAGFGGGPEKTILNSPRFLEPLGYESYCAYLHAAEELPSLAERAALQNAPLVPILDRGAWDWQVLPQLIRICREKKVDVWHAHEYKSNVLGLIVRRYWPMKLVSTVHGWIPTTRRLRFYRWLDKRVLPYYDKVICVSDDLHRACLEAGVGRARSHCIHNAIDTDEFRRTESATDARRKFGAAASGTLLGAMGRLSEEKGFDLLIWAVAELIQRGRAVSLWIAGEGPLRSKLVQMVRESGCEQYIRLLGHVAEPRDFFHAVDLFVLSSLREGLPNVVLEAMAMEVPVLATDIAGVPALVQDGENGLLVQPGSVPALVAGMERLLSDRPLAATLADAGRRTVEKSYAFESRMRKVAAVYDTLMSDGQFQKLV